MRYTKEIFDILSRGGFISQNSVSQQKTQLYDAIEDDYNEYLEYYKGIGFILESGNGYYYFTRTENKVDLENKIQRMAEWIDRVDFLKVFNSTFDPGFTFRKSNIMEQFANDIELKEKSGGLYPEEKSLENKVESLVKDLEKQGFVEMENELDGTYKVTSAFHYIEEMIDCLTIYETEDEQ